MRYLVFSGECYYAKGGGHDFDKAFDVWEDAVNYASNLIIDDVVGNIEWWHIFDCEKKEIILKSECQAHGAN